MGYIGADELNGSQERAAWRKTVLTFGHLPTTHVASHRGEHHEPEVDRARDNQKRTGACRRGLVQHGDGWGARRSCAWVTDRYVLVNRVFVDLATRKVIVR
jgi:hypothetical protein